VLPECHAFRFGRGSPADRAESTAKALQVVATGSR
jgi:hypothetical protein